MSNGEKAAALAQATQLLQGVLELCDQHDIGLTAAPYIDLALTKLVSEQAAIETGN